MKNNEQGFSALEIILIVVIVAMVGGVSWFVWNSKNKTNATYNNSTNATTSVKPAKGTATKTSPTPLDPTSSWTPYGDTSNKLSLRYPTTWVKATHPELCSAGILLLGPTAQSVGACGSGNVGEVEIVAQEGDQRTTNGGFSTPDYSDIQSSTVNVDSVGGKKYSATLVQPSLGADMAPGTKMVAYEFYSNGKTYDFSYRQAPTYPDALSDFDLLVTKTVKFQ